MEIVIFTGFGLIIGSFLNVLIVRESNSRSLSGRSACMSCGRELAWFDLVPVFSWLLLRGRCRYCDRAISVQYPLVEITTAALFAMIGLSMLPATLQIVGALIVSLYVAITVYDLYYTVIPDAWSYGAAALALLYSAVASGMSDIAMVILGGPIVAFPLFTLWIVSKGRWMGLGDVKLALSIGWLLGPFVGLASLLGAFILGAFISICILLPLPYVAAFGNRLGITFFRLKRGGFTMESEVPFGPFLIVSCLLFWFLQLYGVPSPLEYLGF